MKKNIFICALLLVGFATNAQRVNDKVEIEHNGSWYEGTILRVSDNQYYVTYEGWSDSWDEWVPITRLRNYQSQGAVTGKFQVGDRVQVEYGMVPEPATIIEVGENKYHIEYDRKIFGKKWVTEGEIKRL